MKTGSRIESIGVALPEKKVCSQSITDRMKLSPPVKLELISGIKERRFCSGKEDTISLAVAAAYDCLSYSSYEPRDIEMIIFCGISKLRNELTYYYEPSISATIAREIHAPVVLHFDILNACAGMVTAIHIANDYIQRGFVKNCMVVSGEFISSICHNAVKNMLTRMSPEMASLTLGDAGAAIMLEHTTTQQAFEVVSLQTFGKHSKLCTARLSNKFPGAQMFTQMQKLFKASIKEAPQFLEESLSESGLSYGDIDYLIPHQTATRAMVSGSRSFSEYFHSEPKELVNNIKYLGNTASTTHFLALYDLLKTNTCKKDDRILLLSFASGLVVGVVVFKINNLIEKYTQ